MAAKTKNAGSGPLLVAWDGSPGSRAAIEEAVRIAPHGEIVLAFVIHETRAHQTTTIDREAALDALEHELASLRERGVRARMRIAAGAVAPLLLKIVREEQPSLVLVGAKAFGPDAAPPGLVARTLLRKAPAPALVVRATGTSAAPGSVWPRRIIVGIDFSPASTAALDQAALLAMREKTSVTLLHVTDSTGQRVPPATAQARLEEIARAFQSAGIPATACVVFGSPEKALVAEAESDPSAIVVVGTRTRGAFRRRLLGSVAEAVVHRAPGAVLVAHPTLRPMEGAVSLALETPPLP
ncbi:MAG TPA: universal stress protein [bacterium]|nr:universal stress protein [bacterium]